MSKKKKKKKKKKGPEMERGAFPNKTAARRLAYNLLILNAPGEKQGSNRENFGNNGCDRQLVAKIATATTMVARRRKAFSDETAVSSSSPFSWCKACIVMQAHGGSEWNGVQMDGCRERPRRCVQTPKATSEAKQSMQQQQGQGVAAAAAHSVFSR
uniref:Uncharacterized protein n=1 Tax=Oryza sativa subsp. japonica TaxID=39947 RepID=Q5Z8R8_ORYSJ|nr:hypothetical protein [Oryza sativa Japonica Group]BAD53836.1 hypothetical protein [Oryza sativa Japonica Group]